MEYTSDIDYWHNKPSAEELEKQKATVRIDLTRLDMNDPDALEKWKYPSRFETAEPEPEESIILAIGDRALDLVDAQVPEAA